MDRLFLSDTKENNDRGDKKSPPKKNFNEYKKNTLNSIHDVEHFLNNFHYYFKYFKLYKIMRK